MRDHENRTANKETEEIKAPATEQEQESETKFAGGKPPPVTSAFHDAGGTSSLAFEEDANEKELKTKVGRLVEAKHSGEYKKAFEHYDHDKNGSIGRDELVQLLTDAGVGNSFTRGAWASKIIDKLDTDSDHEITWGEFESVFRAHV